MGDRRWETGVGRQEMGGRERLQKMGDRRWETRDVRLETFDRRHVTEQVRQEMRDRTQDTEDRKMSGDRISRQDQETGDGRQETRFI